MLEKFLETVPACINPLIRISPALILIIIAIRVVDKTKNDTHLGLNIIRWVFICYAALTLINFAVHYETAFENEAFRLRVMGPYWWAYWTMMFFNSVFPLILLNKNLGRNSYLLLFISIMMNIGYWFEQFVIVLSLHRDYI